MKLSEYFAADNIIADLNSSGKEQAIHELVQKLCASGTLTKAQAASVEKSILDRERKGSTGIGKGVAVPHAKVTDIKGVMGAFGRSAHGVEFGALDGQPVHLIFLLVSSPDMVEPHLEALHKVTALLKDDDFCAFFRRAKTEKELSELLHEADGRLKV